MRRVIINSAGYPVWEGTNEIVGGRKMKYSITDRGGIIISKDDGAYVESWSDPVSVEVRIRKLERLKENKRRDAEAENRKAVQTGDYEGYLNALGQIAGIDREIERLGEILDGIKNMTSPEWKREIDDAYDELDKKMRSFVCDTNAIYANDDAKGDVKAAQLAARENQLMAELCGVKQMLRAITEGEDED